MGFDQSRSTFDPRNDYSGVVMQQGRVQMDADWNEWLAELNRRIQCGTLDTIGRAAYPTTTPSAFKITASNDAQGNHIRIGAGRMYVDGLLAENHGPVAAASWDPALGEMSGAPMAAGVAAATIDFSEQPYLPGATLSAGNGPFLVYLDVWRRPVSHLQDRTLVDPAVGVDTTGRLQTVWQVKLLDVSKVPGVACDTPDTNIPDWQDLIRPSAGRLSNDLVASSSSGPCCLSPNTGYTGMENQLYRVEIHRKGNPVASSTTPTVYPLPSGSTTATFKWSRDNASVATAVTGIAAATNTLGNPASQLAVESLGRDQVLGFAPGNWIELIDDVQELNGQPGELHRIDSIDFAARTIMLDSPVDPSRFPVKSGATDPDRHTRIRRWDQSGKVYLSDHTTVWVDLGAAGSSGDIPVPPAGTTLILEQGITVTFELNPGTGSFHVGDFWTFAARAADASIEPLVKAYPQGIHHHFARLSIVTFPSTATDCRVPWPQGAGEGSSCCCDAVIRPSDITPERGLQEILDDARDKGTSTSFCLMQGTYRLTRPLRLSAAHSGVRLHGCEGGEVRIVGRAERPEGFADGLVVLDHCANVELRNLVLEAPPSTPHFAGGSFAGVPIRSLDPDVQSVLNNLRVRIGVRPVGCEGLVVQDCRFDLTAGDKTQADENVFLFGVGILAAGRSSGWRIEGNTFAGAADFTAGILLAPSVVFSPQRRRSLANPGAPAAAPRPSNPVSAERLTARAQTLLATATSTPDLAAGGGKVLPTLLEGSDLEDNTFSNLTIAVLSMSTLGMVELRGNVVEDCRAGTWLLSPARAGLLVSDPGNLAIIGLSIAIGYPLPATERAGDNSWVTVPHAPASVRSYTGLERYTDGNGSVWLPDSETPHLAVTGGSLFTPKNPHEIAGAKPADTDQALYRSERSGTFSYTFQNLPRGFYSLTLKFAEIRFTGEGAQNGPRIFNVAVNNQPVLTDLDIVADVGANDQADDWRFDDLVPDQSGGITVQFTGTTFGPAHDAKVSAASLVAQWSADFLADETSLVDQAGGRGNREFPYFYLQLRQLAQQGFVGLANQAGRIRLTDNEMHGLSAPAVLLLGEDEVQSSSPSSLLMNGNRLSANVPILQYFRSIGVLLGRGDSQEIAQEQRGRGEPLPGAYFRAVAGISGIIRCSLTGNQIVNEAPIRSSLLAFTLFRVSLVLDDGALSPPSVSTPPPELLVASNLFQGQILVLPERDFPSKTTASPVNAWEFLNSVYP